MPDVEIEMWQENFMRTLAEALHLGGAERLGIDARELAATTRRRPFGSPEIVLYDSVPGGAGYARLLQERNLRDLLKAGAGVLDCPASCTFSCRACLQSYDNQLHWERFGRQPVLEWLRAVLGTDQPPNPFARFCAAPFVMPRLPGPALALREIESSTHAVAVAPTLFALVRGMDPDGPFTARDTAEFVGVSWPGWLARPVVGWRSP